MAVDNRTLGKFILDGLPPAQRGIPQIEVTFDVDANGILHVNAKDKASGKEQSIRIESSSGLSEQEINKMKKEANAHAAEDKQKKEEIETKNQADTIVYQTEKQMKEMEEKMEADDKTKLETVLGRLKEAQKSGNVEEMKSAIEGVNTTWNEVTQKLYAQAGPQPGAEEAQPGAEQAQAGATPEDGADEAKVEDADYEVVDDDKKN